MSTVGIRAILDSLTNRGAARVRVDGTAYEVRILLCRPYGDSEEEPMLTLDNVSLLLESEEASRDAKAMGWERAHTMLCSKAQCYEHRNPWQRSRADTGEASDA